MDFFSEFGIKPTLLLAQAVNFLILLVLLKKFLYNKILEVLDERRKKIAKALKDAEETEKLFSQAQEGSNKIIAKAKGEAQRFIENAQDEAEKIIKNAQERTRQDTERMLLEFEDRLVEERSKMRQELKEETADLVVLAFKKIAGKILNKTDQKVLVQRSIKDLYGQEIS